MPRKENDENSSTRFNVDVPGGARKQATAGRIIYGGNQVQDGLSAGQAGEANPESPIKSLPFFLPAT